MKQHSVNFFVYKAKVKQRSLHYNTHNYNSRKRNLRFDQDDGATLKHSCCY